MKMSNEKHLDSALKAAGLSKLPTQQKKGSFKGLAVIKMKKVGNSITWGLGRWNDELGVINVAQDFDKKMTVEVLEAYPFEKTELQETPKQMEVRIEAEIKAKMKLKELGIEVPEDAKLKDLKVLLKEHQDGLDAIQAERDAEELEELKEWHMNRGYSEGHCNKWKIATIQTARDSKATLLEVEGKIKEFDVEPVGGKKAELDAQLKQLIKDNK